MKGKLTLIFLLFAGLGYSQIIKDELIIKTNFPIQEVLENYKTKNQKINFTIKTLSEDLLIYGLYRNEDFSSTDLDLFSATRGVVSASYNVYTSNRAKPNDPQYNKQWAIELSKINKVWDVTTGGKTYNNEEVVVAVLDDGIDINHQDLSKNIFINKAEIQGDKIDNDGNGVKDDYQGLNINENNGDPISNNHGTGVVGIIGAQGNNQLDVSGVNWNVKILPIYGVNKLDEIIQAYSYILKMKRLYTNSNGAKGANVLVSNYSGGISKAFGNIEPYRSWCELYELMGLEGILSVGSTENENVNVTVVGDMPTTCNSEYFISTTNIDNTASKVVRAAFSKDYVAMAAPGEGIMTLKTNNSIDSDFSGTSASAPMVAGVAALLFSVPCSTFGNLLKLDKAMAAKVVKNAIKDGVKVTSELSPITKWGGYLDAEAALGNMSAVCDGEAILPSPKGPLRIINSAPINNSLIINYVTPDENQSYMIMLSDLWGRVLLRESISIPAFGKKQYVFTNEMNYSGSLIISIFNEKDIASTLTYLHGR